MCKKLMNWEYGLYFCVILLVCGFWNTAVLFIWTDTAFNSSLSLSPSTQFFLFDCLSQFSTCFRVEFGLFIKLLEITLSISDWETAQAELFVWIFCLPNYSIWEKNKCSFYNIRNMNVFELSLTSVANLLPTFLFLKSQSNVGLELKSTC